MRYLYAVLLLLLLASCSTDKGRISSLAYCNYLDRIDDACFQRLLDPRLDRVGCQVSVGQTGGKEIERIRALARNGKKIILQLWWGPGGRYNWSYHSLPAIAYEREVQQDFFAGVGATIDSIGPENIYAAHLLEECGYFGLNIDVPGDWRKNRTWLLDGEEDGNPYSNGKRTQATWSVANPNVRRYAHVLAKDTGLIIGEHPVWTGAQRFAFKRWCETSAARAEIAFFDFLDSKYPGIKKYSWYTPSYPNYMSADFGLLKGRADGFMVDPYENEHFNYQVYREIRTLCPDAEINALIYGGFTNENVRRRRLAAAYLGGATTMGFFEGQGRVGFGTEAKEDIAFAKHYDGAGENMDWQTDAMWGVNMSLLSDMAKVPPFVGKAPVLLVSGRWDCDWRASCHSYLGLKFFDPVPQDSAWLVELSGYDLVIAHGCAFSDYQDYYRHYKVPGPGLDSHALEAYVRNGGLLLLYHGGNPPLFLQDYVELKRPASMELPVDVDCGLDILPADSGQYHLRLFMAEVEPKRDTRMSRLGCLIPYGDGYVYLIPHLNAAAEGKPHYEFERMLADSVRDLLLLKGKSEAAAKAVDDLRTGYNYRMATGDDSVTAGFQFFPRAIDSTRFKVAGQDIFTGEENPEFCPGNSGVIVRQGDLR